jgi:uncharacterized membrane protein/cytochrome c2
MSSFPWLEAHGGVTHFPVALLVMALVFDLGGAVFRKAEWKTVGFWLLVAGVVMAVPALFSGWMTARHLFTGAARPPDMLTLHWRMAALTTVLAVLLLAWRLWRRDTASGPARGATLLLGALTAASVTATGYLGGSMVLGGRARASASPARGAVNAAAVARNRAAFPAARIAAGHRLVMSEAVGCRSCHIVDGVGGKVGPDLSRIGLVQPNIAWQIEHLKNPRSVNPGSAMPAFDHLTPAEREAIAAWLVTRDGSGG